MFVLIYVVIGRLPVGEVVEEVLGLVGFVEVGMFPIMKFYVIMVSGQIKETIYESPRKPCGMEENCHPVILNLELSAATASTENLLILPMCLSFSEVAMGLNPLKIFRSVAESLLANKSLIPCSK
jgi:hypothetical protein